MSANLAPARTFDDAWAPRSTGAVAFEPRHRAAARPSIATRAQQASEEDVREISDLTPMLIVIVGSGQERFDIDQVGPDLLDSAYNQWRANCADAEQHPGDARRVKSHHDVASSSGQPVDSEFWLRRSDGTYRCLTGRIHAVRNEDENVGHQREALAGADDRARVDETSEDQSASCTATGLDSDRLQRVLDYIAANVTSDLTLDKLAGISCYSVFHFARKFTLAMGVSPQRYISRLRLENAMEELGASKLSLAEIALNANFSSQASFTRAFHRATGTTPNAYKRRRRSETLAAQSIGRTS